MGMSFEVAHLRKFEHILDESKFVDGRVFQVEKLDLIYQFKWTWSFTISWFVMKKKMASIIASRERRVSSRNQLV